VVQDAVVDTGSYLSVFPERQWAQRFPAHIRWLAGPGDPALPGWCREVRGLGGGVFPARLGVVRIEFVDPVTGATGRPSDLVAKFASDNGRMREIVLGLDGGTLAGRRLILELDADQAWLEE
jgi:hypothetical protein